MRVFYTAIFIALTAFVVSPTIHARTLGIVQPTADEPVLVDPGKSFSIEIAIPFALTPPPGVQKAVVWRQWSVVLSRMADASFENVSKKLAYELRFLKIRPDEHNVNYVVTAEVQKWLPPGRYAVHVKGPGFRYGAQDSVIISGEVRNALIKITPQGAHAWQIESSSGIRNSFLVEVVIGESVESVSFAVKNDVKLSIEDICWAAFREDSPMEGGRLVRLRLPPMSDSVVLQAKKLRKTEAAVRIVLATDSVRPLEWVALETTASFAPLRYIWRFADGDSDVGQKVNYRWMVTTEAVAEVTVFDRLGGVHKAELRRPLKMPLERNGLSCEMAPQPAGAVSWSGFLLKTWFETFLFLWE